MKTLDKDQLDYMLLSDRKAEALPVPAVFIVDGMGVLQLSFIHPDYKVRVPGKVILAAAQVIAGREQYVKPER